MVVDVYMLLHVITIHLYFCVESPMKVLVFMNVVCHYVIVIVEVFLSLFLSTIHSHCYVSCY